MLSKKLFSLLLAALVLVGALAAAGPAQAAPVQESVCGETWTVRAGDVLSRIAQRCGVTKEGILRANPAITNPNLLSIGQVLILPGATLPNDLTTQFYYIQHGDTLKEIAYIFHSTVDELLSLNPQIKEADRIFAGQRMIVPVHDNRPGQGGSTAGTQMYTVQRGDTLKGIAARFATTTSTLRRLNPEITNPDHLQVGQRIRVPIPTGLWTVQEGDTLGGLAIRFNTTVAELLRLNPQISDPHVIRVGQVIRVQ